MEVNQITDITLFGFTFLSIACGWIVGYTKGVINGYNHAKAEGLDEHPIINVVFWETDNQDEFLFNDMLSGDFIVKGSFDDCINMIKPEGDQRVVFSHGDKDEQ